MDNTTFARLELYDLVWAEPITAIAKRYNTTDVAIRKACTELSVPLPKVGHWQKIQFGKKIDKEPLPSDYTGPDKYTIKIQPKNPNLQRSEIKNKENSIQDDITHLLPVPQRRTKPDNLIVEAQKFFSTRDHINHNGLIASYQCPLDITVTKKNVARALRFMDTLIKVLRFRNHDINTDHVKMRAVISGESMEISLREKLKRIEKVDAKSSWDRYEYLPTGLLVFKIDGYYGKEWIDGKTLIEEQIPAILTRLENESARIKQQREEARRSHEEYEKKTKN